MKKTVSKILIDMIPVVLGILLALLINDWQSTKNDKRFVKNTLSTVKLEIQKNEKELLDIIPKHHNLNDTIQIYVNDTDVSLADLLNKMGGFKGITLNNSSWKAFLNNKMELIDYQTISTLSDIDESRDAMKAQMNKMMGFVYATGNITAKSYDIKETFRMIVMDILYSEETLLELHQELLAQESMK